MTDKFYGIADAHGIESFLAYEKKSKDKFPYVMRAELNRQRHAVYYVITINDVDASSPTQDAVLPPVQSSGAAWPQAPADAPWDSV